MPRSIFEGLPETMQRLETAVQDHWLKTGSRASFRMLAETLGLLPDTVVRTLEASPNIRKAGFAPVMGFIPNTKWLREEINRLRAKMKNSGDG